MGEITVTSTGLSFALFEIYYVYVFIYFYVQKYIRKKMGELFIEKTQTHIGIIDYYTLQLAELGVR